MADIPTPYPQTDISPQHGLGWIERTEPAVLQAVPTDDSTEDADGGGSEWRWVAHPPTAAPAAPSGVRTTWMPRRVWLILLTALSVAAVLVVAGIVSIADRDYTPAMIPTLTASPPTTTTSAAAGACAGLSGQTVTDGQGDTHSQAGVIAAFEHAYYVQRNAEAALRLIAPEVGIIPEALAAGIASIPPGTVHCVAITPIADGAADVHLVELHPDGQRIDYLQLINVGHNPDGATVITNVQKRG
ncbi:hypothetical protein ABZV58_28655 [Nocardia sp. NPDC004654]|uniref:hypothetical protein n=1 Tax=Nocardia sp. NPDC004654 TaxID=3154776 RepID=UPI0033B4D064